MMLRVVINAGCEDTDADKALFHELNRRLGPERKLSDWYVIGENEKAVYEYPLDLDPSLQVLLENAPSVIDWKDS